MFVLATSHLALFIRDILDLDSISTSNLPSFQIRVLFAGVFMFRLQYSAVLVYIFQAKSRYLKAETSILASRFQLKHIDMKILILVIVVGLALGAITYLSSLPAIFKAKDRIQFEITILYETISLLAIIGFRLLYIVEVPRLRYVIMEVPLLVFTVSMIFIDILASSRSKDATDIVQNLISALNTGAEILVVIPIFTTSGYLRPRFKKNYVPYFATVLTSVLAMYSLWRFIYDGKSSSAVLSVETLSFATVASIGGRLMFLFYFLRLLVLQVSNLETSDAN